MSVTECVCVCVRVRVCARVCECAFYECFQIMCGNIRVRICLCIFVSTHVYA
jgi:hypothetical protein